MDPGEFLARLRAWVVGTATAVRARRRRILAVAAVAVLVWALGQWLWRQAVAGGRHAGSAVSGWLDRLHVEQGISRGQVAAAVAAGGLLAGLALTAAVPYVRRAYHWARRHSSAPPAGAGPVAVPAGAGRDWSKVATRVTAATTVGALFFTGLSVRATEEEQVTDRYSTAVETHTGLGSG